MTRNSDLPSQQREDSMTARRALGLLLIAVAAAAVLHTAGSVLPVPPVAEPARLDEWWADNGAAVAVLTLARLGGLAFCCYLALISLLGAVAAVTRWRWTLTLTMWAATPALRRAFAGGSLALALASGSATTAAAAPAPYSVTDMGAVEGFQPESALFASDSPPGPAVTRAHYSVTDLGASPVPADHRVIVDVGTTPTVPARYSVTDLGPAPSGPRAAQADQPPRPTARVADHSPDPHQPGAAAGRSAGAHTATGHAARADEQARTATRDTGRAARADTATGHAARADDQARTTTGHATGAEDQPEGAAGDTGAADDTRATGGPSTWLVEPGDHLWGIAAATVTERSGSEDHMTIVRYWLKLIEANADTVGDNPDLIRPGQIIRLPD